MSCDIIFIDTQSTIIRQSVFKWRFTPELQAFVHSGWDPFARALCTSKNCTHICPRKTISTTNISITRRCHMRNVDSDMFQISTIKYWTLIKAWRYAILTWKRCSVSNYKYIKILLGNNKQRPLLCGTCSVYPIQTCIHWNRIGWNSLSYLLNITNLQV